MPHKRQTKFFYTRKEFVFYKDYFNFTVLLDAASSRFVYQKFRFFVKQILRDVYAAYVSHTQKLFYTVSHNTLELKQ